MRPAESEASMRVYGGFARAVLAVAPVGPLAPVRGADARIAAGFAVHRNNVRAAYLRALGEAFPVIARLVGDGFFKYLAHEYFRAYPPKSPLVSRYGESLPEFLAHFEPALSHPYLSDVARLEIAWLNAYHAADIPVLTAEEIFSRIGAQPLEARLCLHPSATLLASRHAVHTIWRHNRDKRSDTLRAPAGGERLLIARPGADVVTTPLSTDVFLALQELAGGAPLGAALERVLSAHPNLSVAALIQSVVSTGVVVSASVDQGGFNAFS